MCVSVHGYVLYVFHTILAMSFPAALRLFLCDSGFRLPGESQKVCVIITEQGGMSFSVLVHLSLLAQSARCGNSAVVFAMRHYLMVDQCLFGLGCRWIAFSRPLLIAM